jgi:hypothetical protein
MYVFLDQNAKTILFIVLIFILLLSGTNYLIIVQGFSIKLQGGLVRILEAYLQIKVGQRYRRAFLKINHIIYPYQEQEVIYKSFKKVYKVFQRRNILFMCIRKNLNIKNKYIFFG